MRNGDASLCGGRLSEGRCTLCGLDNTIYKREIAYSEGSSQEESRQEQKQHIKAQVSEADPPAGAAWQERNIRRRESIVRLQLQPADPVTEPARRTEKYSGIRSAYKTEKRGRGGRVHSANNNKTRSGTSCSYRYSADYTVLVPACGNEKPYSQPYRMFLQIPARFLIHSFSDSYDEEDSDYDPLLVV